jgi:hypothetical protein
VNFRIGAPYQAALPVLFVLSVFGFLGAAEDSVKEFPMQG